MMDQDAFVVRDLRNPGWCWLERAALDRIKSLDDPGDRRRCKSVYVELCQMASEQLNQASVETGYQNLADRCDLSKGSVIQAITILCDELHLLKKQSVNGSQGNYKNSYDLLATVRPADSRKMKQSAERTVTVSGEDLPSILEKKGRKAPISLPPSISPQELQGAQSSYYPRFDPRHPAFKNLRPGQGEKLRQDWEAKNGPYKPLPDFDVKKFIKENS